MDAQILKSLNISSNSVKTLRETVLVAEQCDPKDKASRKEFKTHMKKLETDGKIRISEDGIVSLAKEKRKGEGEEKGEKKAKKEKKEKKEKKSKKEKEDSTEPTADDDEPVVADATEEHPEADVSLTSPVPSAEKNKPCKGNRDGVTRLFLGNLPFKVDEQTLKDHLPGTLTHVKWITDKETGRFYGSAFIEMLNSVDAASAVGVAGSELMGRALKINFAPAREGDIWPPTKTSTTGGQAGSNSRKTMSEKPENCTKLFIGNLSYDIDDDGIFKFFENVEAEVKAVRWLHHKDSGDFKGVGYVEFWNTEACDKAATLNGKNLLGRPIRIDWTD